MSVRTGSWPAFRALVRAERLLLLREPAVLLWGVAFPVLLLTIMGIASSGPDADLGGLRLVQVYQPVVIAMVLATLGGSTLPAVLTTYRETRVLRRLATTPVRPFAVLAAQLLVNLGVCLVATALILAVGRAAFGVALPRQPVGFALVLLLAAAALLALGLVVAALAPSGRAAAGIGSLLFFPMMFFAGLWIPRPLMPSALRSVGDFTPLGAAVSALGDTSAGRWPTLSAIVVLAAFLVAFTTVAARYFRWE